MSINKVVDGNFQELIDAIKAVNDSSVYPVFIPSLQKNVMFKEMTTKQEKTIVKTIIDNPVYNSEFIFAIRNIIQENCAEDINVDELTLIDKTAISLMMRLKSIGPTFDYHFKNYEAVENVQIQDVVDNFASIKIPDDVTVGNERIQVVCGYPTIRTEYLLEHEFRSNSESTDVNSVKEARDIIGNIFTNEVIKYIKEVKIINEDSTIIIDMDDYEFKNRITILETIGNSVTSKVLDYIEDCTKNIRNHLKIVKKLSSEDQGVYDVSEITGYLEAGSDFFTIS